MFWIFRGQSMCSFSIIFRYSFVVLRCVSLGVAEYQSNVFSSCFFFFPKKFTPWTRTPEVVLLELNILSLDIECELKGGMD